MTDTPKIEACPWCGESVKLHLHGESKDGKGWWHQYCGVCRAEGASKPTHSEATAAWNSVAGMARRAAEEVVDLCASESFGTSGYAFERNKSAIVDAALRRALENPKC